MSEPNLPSQHIQTKVSVALGYFIISNQIEPLQSNTTACSTDKQHVSNTATSMPPALLITTHVVMPQTKAC